MPVPASATREFKATFTPHGLNPDALEPVTWSISTERHAQAMDAALGRVGEMIQCADFAYRDLADGSVTILDTVRGSAKIGSLRLVQPSRR